MVIGPEKVLLVPASAAVPVPDIFNPPAPETVLLIVVLNPPSAMVSKLPPLSTVCHKIRLPVAAFNVCGKVVNCTGTFKF